MSAVPRTILALETSTAQGSVLLCRGADILFEHTFSADRSHNSQLFQPLAAALAIAKADLVVVGTGPGSYTGVRVSLAAALGLGLALPAPVIGLPSLAAFDAPDECQIVGDARRGSFFLATLRHGKLVGPPVVAPQEEIAARLHGPVFTFDSAPLPFGNPTPLQPRALVLARQAATLSEADISALAAVTPEPLYLRPPFITQPRTAIRRVRQR